MTKTLLYIPDSLDSNSNPEAELNAISAVFGDEYEVITIDEPMTDADMFMLMFDGLVDNRSYPDLIISKGYGGYVTFHHGGGINRICINPKMDMQELNEIQPGLGNEYLEFQPDHFQCSKRDKAMATYAWCITDRQSIIDESSSCYDFYPNIQVAHEPIELNEEFVRKSIKPLVETINCSEWTDEYGVHFSNFGRTIDGVEELLFNKCEEYTIPHGVTHIEGEVFSGMENLKRLNICDSVREIGEECFKGCSRLSEVFINAPQLLTLPNGCFEDCVSLKQVTFERTRIKTIGPQCFANTDLSQFEVPDSLVYMRNSAFPESCKMILSYSKCSSILYKVEEFEELKDKVRMHRMYSENPLEELLEEFDEEDFED